MNLPDQTEFECLTYKGFKPTLSKTDGKPAIDITFTYVGDIRQEVLQLLYEQQGLSVRLNIEWLQAQLRAHRYAAPDI